MVFIYLLEELVLNCVDCKKDTIHEVAITKAVQKNVSFLRTCTLCRKHTLGQLTPEEWNAHSLKDRKNGTQGSFFSPY